MSFCDHIRNTIMVLASIFTLTFLAQPAIAADITSINPTEVSTEGGENIDIYGGWFRKKWKVVKLRLAGSSSNPYIDCPNGVRHNGNHVSCTSPAMASTDAGSYDVIVGRYNKSGVFKEKAILSGGLSVVAPVVENFTTLVYSCSTPRGTVYMRPSGFNYGGTGNYLVMRPAGPAAGSFSSGSTTDCTVPGHGLGTARQKCVFFDNPNGRWSIQMQITGAIENAAQNFPAVTNKAIANHWDCENYALQQGVSIAMCQAAYSCTKEFINIEVGTHGVTEADFNPSGGSGGGDGDGDGDGDGGAGDGGAGDGDGDGGFGDGDGDGGPPPPPPGGGGDGDGF